MIKSRLRVQDGSIFPFLAALFALAGAAMVFVNFKITSGDFWFSVNMDRIKDFSIGNIGWLLVGAGLLIMGISLLFVRERLWVLIIPSLLFSAGIGVQAYLDLKSFMIPIVAALIFTYILVMVASHILNVKVVPCLIALAALIATGVLVYLKQAPFVATENNGKEYINLALLLPQVGFYLSMILMSLSLTKDSFMANQTVKKTEAPKETKPETPKETPKKESKKADTEDKKKKKDDGNANWALLGKPNVEVKLEGQNDAAEQPVDITSEEEEKRRQKEREAKELYEARKKIEENRKRMMGSAYTSNFQTNSTMESKLREEEKQKEAELQAAEKNRMEAQWAQEEKKQEERARQAEEARIAEEARLAAIAEAERLRAKEEAERLAAQRAEEERLAEETRRIAEEEENKTVAESTGPEPVLTVPVSGSKLQKTLKEEIVYDRDQKLMYKKKLNIFSVLGLVLSVLCILLGAIMLTKMVNVAALQNDNLGIPLIVMGLAMICVFGTRLSYKEYYTKTIVTERKVVREEINWEEVLANRLEEDEKNIRALTANYTRMSEMYGRLLESNAELLKGISEMSSNLQVAGPVQTAEEAAFAPEESPAPMEFAPEDFLPAEDEIVAEDAIVAEEFVPADDIVSVEETFLPAEDGTFAPAEEPVQEEAPITEEEPEYVEDNNPLNDEPINFTYEAPDFAEMLNDVVETTEESVENIATVEAPIETDEIAAEPEEIEIAAEPEENVEDAIAALTEELISEVEESIISDEEELPVEAVEAPEEEPVQEEAPVNGEEPEYVEDNNPLNDEPINYVYEAPNMEETPAEEASAPEEEFSLDSIMAEEPEDSFLAAFEEPFEELAAPAEVVETVDTINEPEEVTEPVEEFANSEELNDAVEDILQETPEENASAFGNFGWNFGENSEPAFTTESVEEQEPEKPVEEPEEKKEEEDNSFGYGNSGYTGYNDSLISSMFSRYQKKTVEPEPVKEVAEEVVNEPVAETVEDIIGEQVPDTVEENIHEPIMEHEVESTSESEEEVPEFTLPTFRGFNHFEPEEKEEEEENIFRGFGYDDSDAEATAESTTEELPTNNRFESNSWNRPEEPDTDEEDDGIIEGFVLPTFRGFSTGIEDEDEEMPEIKPSAPLSSEPRIASSGISFFSAPTYGSQEEEEEPDEEPSLPTFAEEIPESTYTMPLDEEEPDDPEPILPVEDDHSETETPQEPLSPEEERRRKLQEKLAEIYNRNRERQMQEAAKDNFDDLNFDDPVIYFGKKDN